MAEGELEWLDSKHPVWVYWSDFWLRQERRLFGVETVKEELMPFSSEAESVKGGLLRYGHRQRQATYLNFPDVAATAFVGQLSKQAPQPGQQLNFGPLGIVRDRDKYSPGSANRAEMLWYNVDGIGNDGSQWTPWWDAVTKRAKATGHRWCMAEAPSTEPSGFADEIEGLRPFMVEYSPYQVTNWHYRNGQLEWVIIRIPQREPRIVDGSFVGNDFADGYYFLVKEGWDGWGTEYQGGGWWLFDSDKKLVDTRPWLKTAGKIPFWAHFYEQVRIPIGGIPTISRSGLSEIGNVAVSYMNQSSARDYDAWDAAKSLLFALGISNEGWKLLQDLLEKGSEILPILGEQNPVSGTAAPVSMWDGSQGAVVADVFEKLLASKINEAKELSNYEAKMSPDASGAAQTAKYNEVKSPRLSLMASNREQSENTGLFFLSQRWGIAAPQANTRWSREFDLAPLQDDIDKMFATLKLAGVKTKTLTTEMIVLAARKRGLIKDVAMENAIRAEVGSGMDAADEAAAAERDALKAFGAEPEDEEEAVA